MTTEERIREDAEEYAEAFKTGEWFENLRKEAHIAGATRERNKVLDQAITFLEENKRRTIADTGHCDVGSDAYMILKGHEYEAHHAIQYLSSLKVKE